MDLIRLTGCLMCVFSPVACVTCAGYRCVNVCVVCSRLHREHYYLKVMVIIVVVVIGLAMSPYYHRRNQLNGQTN